MAQDMWKKVAVAEQDPEVRAKNFDEVCLGYSKEEAMEEAARCFNCKNGKVYTGLSRINQHPGIHSGDIKGRY